MTRLMYDALHASDIPHDVAIACWYPYDIRSDGPPQGARQVLTIDNEGTHYDCDILDYENGAASDPDQWLAQKEKQGVKGTIYCSASNKNALDEETRRPYYWWVADWTGKDADIFPGSVAQQYSSFEAYDLSVVVDDNWFPVNPSVIWWEVPVAQLPVVAYGYTNITMVKRVQGLLVASGYFIGISGVLHDGIDGVYGAMTKSAVEAVQLRAGFPKNGQDGIVGPQTWPILLGVTG